MSASRPILLSYPAALEVSDSKVPHSSVTQVDCYGPRCRVASPSGDRPDVARGPSVPRSRALSRYWTLSPVRPSSDPSFRPTCPVPPTPIYVIRQRKRWLSIVDRRQICVCMSIYKHKHCTIQISAISITLQTSLLEGSII